MATASDVDRRFRITVYRPQASAGQQPAVALDLPGLTTDQLEQVRALVDGHLGPGFVAAIDGEIITRGPPAADPRSPPPAPAPPVEETLEHTRRLTELAVQQHEYCYAELQRLRRDYEEDFAQERAILRTLRQRWLEWVCDDKVHGEDAVRYLVGVIRETVTGKKEGSGGESKAAPG